MSGVVTRTFISARAVATSSTRSGSASRSFASLSIDREMSGCVEYADDSNGGSWKDQADVNGPLLRSGGDGTIVALRRPDDSSSPGVNPHAAFSRPPDRP